MPTVIGYSAKIRTWLAKFLNLKETINPVRPALSEYTLPIIDMGWYLGHQMIDTNTISIDATGNFEAFVAESTHRYRIDFMHIFRASGTWTFDEIYIYDASKADSLTLDVISSATGYRYPENFGAGTGTSIWLEPNDKIYVNIDAQSVTGNLTCKVWAKIWKTNKERDPWRDL